MKYVMCIPYNVVIKIDTKLANLVNIIKIVGKSSQIWSLELTNELTQQTI